MFCLRFNKNLNNRQKNSLCSPLANMHLATAENGPVTLPLESFSSVNCIYKAAVYEGLHSSRYRF